LKKRLDDYRCEVLRAKAVSWLRERIDWQPLTEAMAKKTVPIHRHTWIYLLGGAALFLFGFQVATGCLLALYYQPSESTAYESVGRIMTQVPYGWLIRSVHDWGASLFIGVTLLHFLTVLFSRAYRKPRELTWLSGALMLALALGFGFSGYLLPWNELSYYATRVGTKIPAALPVVGDVVVHFLRGGEEVTGDTITRFFAGHTVILPLVFGALLAIHLIMIQFQGQSLPLGMPSHKVRDQRPFFSEFLLIDACVWLLLLGAIVTLAVFLPAEVGEKADVLKPAPLGIKPEWYFLFMFKTLKLVPEALGVAIFALGALFFLAVPFLDRNARLERSSRGLTALFAIALLYVAIFQVLACLEPGVERAPEVLKADTYSLSRGIINLLLFWTVISMLWLYLGKLLRENTRIRRLYAKAGELPETAAGCGELEG
jgi:cytochrome b6